MAGGRGDVQHGRLGIVINALAPGEVRAGVAGATFISITAPPAGPVYDLQPTITVSYSSDDPQAPLDLGTLNVTVNAADWTGRAERGQASWTYALTAADALVAGMLVIEAAISDTGGGSAFARQPYEVFPTLQAVVPGAAHEGDEITVEALGLDPAPAPQGVPVEHAGRRAL